MGYRSEVVALFYTSPVAMNDQSKEENDALNKRNMATLDLFMKENFPESLAECLTKEEADGRVVWKFYEGDTKWYEAFPEVQEFDNFWDKFVELVDTEANEGDDPIFWACEFIRIGENDEDIEIKASHEAEWLARVQRTIEFNY